jgi:non-ribosomal peptide synthetase component E (peptide arylation enzyme)
VDSVISHHQRTRLSYDALDRASNQLARGLQKIGVKKGERVAVSLGNNVEFATVCDEFGDSLGYGMLMHGAGYVCAV